MRGFVDGWNQLGSQTAFYVRALGLVWDAIVRYRTETLRLIANMSLGVGALAVIGGTVVIVTTLTMSTGGLVGIQLYRSLSDVGVQALSGFASAYVNTRIASPLIACVGLAATIGAGATAQLGAMRINEEIDALEVMGIHTITYLASTRVVAGVIVVIPLYCMSALAGFLATWTRYHRHLRPVRRRLRPLLQYLPATDRPVLVVAAKSSSRRWPSCWCTPITVSTPRAARPASVRPSVARCARH